MNAWFKAAIVGIATLPGALPSCASLACPLSNATYREPNSGTVIQFRPLDHEPAAATTGVFAVIVPNSKESLKGDVTWSNGRNTRPYGTILRRCSADEMSGDLADAGGFCTLWTGQMFALTDEGAAMMPADEKTTAPKGILLPDFGAGFAEWDGFYSANPNRFAWDWFSLSGCSQ